MSPSCLSLETPHDECMDLLVEEKSSQPNSIPAEYYTRLVAPHTPDFNVGISKLEMLRFSPGGTFDRKKVRNQNTRCVSPTLKSGGPGESLVAEAYVSIVSMV